MKGSKSLNAQLSFLLGSSTIVIGIMGFETYSSIEGSKPLYCLVKIVPKYLSLTILSLRPSSIKLGKVASTFLIGIKS